MLCDQQNDMFKEFELFSLAYKQKPHQNVTDTDITIENSNEFRCNDFNLSAHYQQSLIFVRVVHGNTVIINIIENGKSEEIMYTFHNSNICENGCQFSVFQSQLNLIVVTQNATVHMLSIFDSLNSSRIDLNNQISGQIYSMGKFTKVNQSNIFTLLNSKAELVYVRILNSKEAQVEQQSLAYKWLPFFQSDEEYWKTSFTICENITLVYTLQKQFHILYVNKNKNSVREYQIRFRNIQSKMIDFHTRQPFSRPNCVSGTIVIKEKNKILVLALNINLKGILGPRDVGSIQGNYCDFNSASIDELFALTLDTNHILQPIHSYVTQKTIVFLIGNIIIYLDNSLYIVNKQQNDLKQFSLNKNVIGIYNSVLPILFCVDSIQLLYPIQTEFDYLQSIIEIELTQLKQQQEECGSLTQAYQIQYYPITLNQDNYEVSYLALMNYIFNYKTEQIYSVFKNNDFDLVEMLDYFVEEQEDCLLFINQIQNVDKYQDPTKYLLDLLHRLMQYIDHFKNTYDLQVTQKNQQLDQSLKIYAEVNGFHMDNIFKLVFYSLIGLRSVSAPSVTHDQEQFTQLFKVVLSMKLFSEEPQCLSNFCTAQIQNFNGNIYKIDQQTIHETTILMMQSWACHIDDEYFILNWLFRYPYIHKNLNDKLSSLLIINDKEQQLNYQIKAKFDINDPQAMLSFNAQKQSFYRPYQNQNARQLSDKIIEYQRTVILLTQSKDLNVHFKEVENSAIVNKNISILNYLIQVYHSKGQQTDLKRLINTVFFTSLVSKLSSQHSISMQVGQYVADLMIEHYSQPRNTVLQLLDPVIVQAQISYLMQKGLQDKGFQLIYACINYLDGVDSDRHLILKQQIELFALLKGQMKLHQATSFSYFFRIKNRIDVQNNEISYEKIHAKSQRLETQYFLWTQDQIRLTTKKMSDHQITLFLMKMRAFSHLINFWKVYEDPQLSQKIQVLLNMCTEARHKIKYIKRLLELPYPNILPTVTYHMMKAQLSLKHLENQPNLEKAINTATYLNELEAAKELVGYYIQQLKSKAQNGEQVFMDYSVLEKMLENNEFLEEWDQFMKIQTAK